MQEAPKSTKLNLLYFFPKFTTKLLNTTAFKTLDAKQWFYLVESVFARYEVILMGRNGRKLTRLAPVKTVLLYNFLLRLVTNLILV